MSKPVPIDNEIDVAWILAVWRAIHGGDPAWQITALEVVAAITATLEGKTHAGSGAAEITSKLQEIGINFDIPKLKTESATQVQGTNDRTYCITYKGKRECVILHGPPPWPTVKSQ